MFVKQKNTENNENDLENLLENDFEIMIDENLFRGDLAEKSFRIGCELTEDDLAILTSSMSYTYITSRDVETIEDYGWDPDDLNNLLQVGDADSITRLAAWIRECGDSGKLIAEDDYSYPLDEDGNYIEPITEGY